MVYSNFPGSSGNDIGGHSSSSLIIARCKIGTNLKPDNSELIPGDHCTQVSAGDDGSTLALKPLGRVNQGLKQRVYTSGSTNDDLSLQK